MTYITYSVASNKHPFWRRKQLYSLYSATSRTGALGRRLSIHNGFWKQTILKFFGKRTTNIHKFEDCSPRGQVSNVFNGCIVEPYILLFRLQKKKKLENLFSVFKKMLWLDNLLPSASVRVVSLQGTIGTQESRVKGLILSNKVSPLVTRLPRIKCARSWKERITKQVGRRGANLHVFCSNWLTLLPGIHRP